MRAEAACREMDGLLAERASGDLPPEERARLEAHLPSCERCQAELARYEEVLRLAGASRTSSSADERAPDLAPSTLRLWKRSRRRRRAAGVAALSGALAAAAAASVTLAPGLHGKGAPHPAREEALVASWEPDVDGALEASGLRRGLDQDEEETSTVDVVLAAFDAAEQTE